MTPPFKLTYFNSRGGGECIRYLCKYGNIEFEDIRHDWDSFLKIKSSIPFGGLPSLEHDGKIANQSLAIARYFAKLVKLVGSDEWENLEIDAIVDTISDLLIKIRPAFFEPNEERRKAFLNVYKNETIPYYLTRFEGIAEQNNGYLAVNKLTWADIFFVSVADRFPIYFKISFEEYPKLNALIQEVEAIPAIKKWIAERPVTRG